RPGRDKRPFRFHAGQNEGTSVQMGQLGHGQHQATMGQRAHGQRRRRTWRPTREESQASQEHRWRQMTTRKELKLSVSTMTSACKHLAKLGIARETTGRNYVRVCAYDKNLEI